MVDSRITDKKFSKKELKHIVSNSIPHLDEAEFDHDYNFFIENLP